MTDGSQESTHEMGWDIGATWVMIFSYFFFNMANILKNPISSCTLKPHSMALTKPERNLDPSQCSYLPI